VEISRKIVKIGRKRRKVAEGGKKEWKGVVCGAKRMEKNRKHSGRYPVFEVRVMVKNWHTIEKRTGQSYAPRGTDRLTGSEHGKCVAPRGKGSRIHRNCGKSVDGQFGVRISVLALACAAVQDVARGFIVSHILPLAS